MSLTNQSSPTIFLVSDGTGETAATMIRAALAQYPGKEISLIRQKNIRSDLQIESLVDEAFNTRAMVVFTLVSPSLQKKMIASCSEKGIAYVNLLEPLMGEINAYLGGEQSAEKVGALRAVDERYFKRIEAIEYTVKHDDGKCLTDLDKADIILVGISRTSKTPLSIFLSHKGWRVANIPLVVNTPLPDELFKVDQRKIVGLIIDISILQRIRRNRLEKFGSDPGGSYASSNYIEQELSYAEEIFKKNKRWPVFNVTERALEETATEITRIVATRMGWPDSAIF